MQTSRPSPDTLIRLKVPLMVIGLIIVELMSAAAQTTRKSLSLGDSTEKIRYPLKTSNNGRYTWLTRIADAA